MSLLAMTKGMLKIMVLKGNTYQISNIMTKAHYTLSFRVTHPKMSSLQISEIVGLKSEFSHDVGSKRPTSNNDPLGGSYKSSYCCFKLEENPQNAIGDSVEKWNLYFASRSAELSQITTTGGILEYFIGIFATENWGFELTPRDLGKLSDLKIKVSFDIYPNSSGSNQ
jgi:hypothetical protein